MVLFEECNYKIRVRESGSSLINSISIMLPNKFIIKIYFIPNLIIFICTINVSIFYIHLVKV